MRGIRMMMSGILLVVLFCSCNSKQDTGQTVAKNSNDEVEQKVEALLAKMTLKEKIGQMSQSHLRSEKMDSYKEKLQKGLIGSFLNVEDRERGNELQKIAVEESRLGIPLIFGRDVIHGFKTIFPIPVGQSCSWNPDLVKEAAAIAAKEAAASGIHWTFAPMIDITRDPRWGRVAETCGEDTYLTSQFAAAMVKGFQGEDLADPQTIAACGKHYVGYGAAESGKDYNTTWIPEPLLRNVYLPSFKAAVDAGLATIMSAFNDINGIPASGNEFTLRRVLRDEWNFDGFVVSDWGSMIEMKNHGYCIDDKDVALKSIKAGVDMEMVSESYINYIEELINEKIIVEELINNSVRNVLRIKFRLGLFDNPYCSEPSEPVILTENNLNTAKELAKQSMVLLQNNNSLLPLSKDIKSLAIIGPMADAPKDQLGCWIPDGKAEDSQTPLHAITKYLGEKVKINYAKGIEKCSSKNKDGFTEAVNAAKKSDAVILFVGEENNISGEAKSRAFINLPGVQEDLIAKIAGTGKPVVLVIMAGRPLTFSESAKKISSVLYAWQPGTMGGPAVAELIFGDESPSGKLSISLPRTVGQIPVYYSHKNTGRPPSKNSLGMEMGTPLNPKEYNSKYIDVDFTPQYPFGFGLSYTTFEYSNLTISKQKPGLNETLTVKADVKNTGQMIADEIVQLYIRDLTGSLTRPVKELKRFERISLKAGESKTVEFELPVNELGFYNNDGKYIVEPGNFHLWVAPNSDEGLKAEFEVVK